MPMTTKKPWTTPTLRRLEMTDDLLDQLARQAGDKLRIPVKQGK